MIQKTRDLIDVEVIREYRWMNVEFIDKANLD